MPKPNIYEFQEYKNQKNNKKYIEVKPIKSLTPAQMKSSTELKRRNNK
jgi:hypothetical protein